MDAIFELYAGMLKSDLEWLQWKWLYLPAFVPFAFFLFYMVLKWNAATLPFWLPVLLASGRFEVIKRK